MPGDRGDLGEDGSDDIASEDLVLKLGNCGGYCDTLTDLVITCPFSVSFSCLAIRLLLIATRTAETRPKLSRMIIVRPMAKLPGSIAIVAASPGRC